MTLAGLAQGPSAAAADAAIPHAWTLLLWAVQRCVMALAAGLPLASTATGMHMCCKPCCAHASPPPPLCPCLCRPVPGREAIALRAVRMLLPPPEWQALSSLAGPEGAQQGFTLQPAGESVSGGGGGCKGWRGPVKHPRLCAANGRPMCNPTASCRILPAAAPRATSLQPPSPCPPKTPLECAGSPEYSLVFTNVTTLQPSAGSGPLMQVRQPD